MHSLTQLARMVIIRVAIVVYIGFRYNAPTQFRYIHIYIHQI